MNPIRIPGGISLSLILIGHLILVVAIALCYPQVIQPAIVDPERPGTAPCTLINSVAFLQPDPLAGYHFLGIAFVVISGVLFIIRKKKAPKEQED